MTVDHIPPFSMASVFGGILAVTQATGVSWREVITLAPSVIALAAVFWVGGKYDEKLQQQSKAIDAMQSISLAVDQTMTRMETQLAVLKAAEELATRDTDRRLDIRSGQIEDITRRLVNLEKTTAELAVAIARFTNGPKGDNTR